MKQKFDLTEIIDEEISLFFQTKNEVMHEYVPIIGATGFLLYSFYKSMANRGAGNAAFPSYELVRKHLGLATSTTNRYNWLLEACSLIRIVKGNARSNNLYRLLKVNPISPELLAQLTESLQPEPTDGKEWAKFKAATLESVEIWKPLRAHFKNQATEPKIVPTVNEHNGHHPAPALPSQPELTAMLMKYFEPEKLSEKAATDMIGKYGVEAVAMQFAWLENRETDTPLRTLRAALKDKWTEPKPVGKPEPKAWWDDGTMELGEDGIVRPKRKLMQDEVNLQ